MGFDAWGLVFGVWGLRLGVEVCSGYVIKNLEEAGELGFAVGRFALARLVPERADHVPCSHRQLSQSRKGLP